MTVNPYLAALMITPQHIASYLEDLVQHLLTALQDFDLKPLEYGIYHYPDHHPGWFIAVFFADKVDLERALADGTCYQMHSFLTKSLAGEELLAEVPRDIFFEVGPRPTEGRPMDIFYLNLIMKYERRQTEDDSEGEICQACGHPFEQHQMLGPVDEKVGTPTHGWMTCDQEGCHCFQTWDLNFAG
ncbi:MAG: hypothetical protein AAFR61_21685 [Bacteroidota bacterium]